MGRGECCTAGDEEVLDGLDSDGLRSEPVSSEETAPLVHLGCPFCCLGRLGCRGVFWEELWAGSESPEDHVNSELESMAEAADPTLALACGCELERCASVGGGTVNVDVAAVRVAALFVDGLDGLTADGVWSSERW